MDDMDELRFDGKVAIVTGAGRGIGAEYARLLAARGAQVIVNDLGIGVTGESTGDAPAEELVNEIVSGGGAAIASDHNVIDEADELIECAMDTYGRIDIVLNNAGITGGGPFGRLTPAQFDLLFDTHFKGTVNVSRAA